MWPVSIRPRAQMMESIAGNDSDKQSLCSGSVGWELEENVINKYEG